VPWSNIVSARSGRTRTAPSLKACRSCDFSHGSAAASGAPPSGELGPQPEPGWAQNSLTTV
jgi:hypothetical protein